MTSIIGIDLGGTKAAIALYDSTSWQILRDNTIETHAENGFAHILDDLVSLIEDMRRDDTHGVGIGVPGLVTQPDGIVVTMPNIPGEKNFPLKHELQKRLSLEVAVDNDANCFALAEAREGAGKNHKVVVGITLGTGVGGGVVIDGQVFTGGHGYAGEIGHMLLKPGEPPYDTPDARGDIEQFLSGTALGKRCEAAKRPEDYLEGEVCSFLQPEIMREVAWMCTNLTHLLDPDVIVFGGSAGKALESHLDVIEQELSQWLLPGTPKPKLAIASLDDAATRGAAMCGRLTS